MMAQINRRLRPPRTLGMLKDRLLEQGYDEPIVELIGDLVVRYMRARRCYGTDVPDHELVIPKRVLKDLRSVVWSRYLSDDEANAFLEKHTHLDGDGALANIYRLVGDALSQTIHVGFFKVGGRG